jgi:HSP20 family molecular chaperone IbpA
MNTASPHSIWPSLTGTFFGESTLLCGQEEIPVNISEEEQQFEIELILPGFSKEDLDIQIEQDDFLKVAGNVPENQEPESKVKRRRDFTQKPFEKSFRLGKNLDRKLIEASFRNGILKISIPKISRENRINSVTIPLN